MADAKAKYRTRRKKKDASPVLSKPDPKPNTLHIHDGSVEFVQAEICADLPAISTIHDPVTRKLQPTCNVAEATQTALRYAQEDGARCTPPQGEQAQILCMDVSRFEPVRSERLHAPSPFDDAKQHATLPAGAPCDSEGEMA